MSLLLKDKIILITGAAKGIGAACASVFLKQGAECVIISDFNEIEGLKKVDELQKIGNCIFIKTDVAVEADVKNVFDIISDRFGKLDILLNVAGICSTESIEQVQMDKWDRIMDVNLKGSFLFMREAFLLMKTKQAGRIITVSSISGQTGGIRTNPAYAASKSGVLSLTKSFAKIGAVKNITVNSIAPGLINTEMTKRPDFNFSVDEVPMGRVGEPEDVANAALFLASDLAGYITGQCINVNGGMYMG